MVLDPGTIQTLIVMAIVTILGFVFRYVNVLDPTKSWLEMAFSIVGGIALAIILGKVTGPGGFADPVAFIQWLLATSAVIFGFVEVIYNLVKQAFPTSALVVKAFKSAKF